MKLWRYQHAIEQLDQRYRLDGLLGSGGMADVCLAWDERDQREVAIKIIKSDEVDQQTLDRFLQEATHLTTLKHPNILRIHSDLKLELLDAAQGSIVPYIIMEYAKGGDLQKRLRQGVPYPLDETLLLFSQLCNAVNYAHEHGVIHRDLKPSNVLFRELPDGAEQVVLTDFGMAVEIQASHQTFKHAGTLPYMAPEHLRGEAVPASDIFSLGVILYLLCTGKLPFENSPQSIKDGGWYRTPLPPSYFVPSLPTTLDEVVFTALATSPEKRFKSAKLLRDALRIAVPDALIAMKQEVPQEKNNYQESQTRAKASRQEVNGRALPSSRAYLSNQRQPIPQAHGSSSSTEEGRQQDNLRTFPALSWTHQKGVQRAPATSTLPQTLQYSPDIQGQTTINPSQYKDHEASSPEAGTNTGQLTQTANKRNIRKKLLTSSVLLPIVLLIIMGVFFKAFGMQLLQTTQNRVTNSSGTAVAVVTPIGKTISDTYTINAVPGQPDPTKHQITAQVLTSGAQTGSQMVKGTGTMQTQAAQQATGTLRFANGSLSSQSIPANTIVKGADGVSIAVDYAFTIPPATIAGETNFTGHFRGGAGIIDVTAHAVQGGAAGNIAAQDVSENCCSQNPDDVYVFNLNPFTGGQDAKSYQFVQQADVDTVVRPMTQKLTQQATQVLRQQAQPGLSLGSGANCPSQVTTDHPIGNTGQNIPTLTATVSVTCTGIAYDQKTLQAEGKTLLQAKALKDLGTGYALQGDVALDVKKQDTNPDQSMTLQVTAKGVWYPTLSSTYLQTLAKKVAGKSASDAHTILSQEANIRLLSIQGTHFPRDPRQVRIVVQNAAKP